MIFKNLSFVETIQAEEVERERSGPGASIFGLGTGPASEIVVEREQEYKEQG